jgi:diguanylate cyclase (GGDEF)-like protein
MIDSELLKFNGENGKQQSLTLLHIDLDRFKQINDTRGHSAGDAVLVHMADMLRSQFRRNDLVARIGGDEFVILLSPSPPPAVLQGIVDRLINLAREPIYWQGHECRCGISIGIAEASGDFDPKQLLVNADIALYRAKNTGRNCAVYFTGRLQSEVIAKKECADDILKGLERSEFLPFYQPIVCAKSYDIASVEALARWQHPVRGLLTPDKFLAVASEFNAVGAIDGTILEQAIEHMKVWDAAGLNIPKISVNVSARRLGSDTLLESLKALPIQAGRISFELLESIFLDDDDDVNTKNIEGLKNLGIGIDVDDFGTGHASIIGLVRLNPNRMKIDRQLTRHIVESPTQRRLVKSLIEIGLSQNIEVCAEGVETAEHARILADLGCDYLQGYYFAKPMPERELVDYVKSQSWQKDAVNLDHDAVTGKTLSSLLAKTKMAKAS